MQGIQRFLDKLRIILRENCTAVPGLISQTGAGRIHHNTIGRHDAARCKRLHFFDAHEMTSGRRFDVAFLTCLFEFIIHAIPKTIFEAAIETTERAAATRFKRKVEEAISFEAMTTKQTRLARVGIHGLLEQAG